MKKIVIIVFCILFTLSVLLFSYRTILSVSNLTPEQQQTIYFLQREEQLSLNYTFSELSHLQDVKQVMSGVDYAFYSSVLVLLIIAYFNRQKKRELIQTVRISSLITLISLGIISLFILISFDYSFTLFHQLFFPRGNWMFSVNSLLIQVFPIDFFALVGQNIFVLSLITALSIYIITRNFK